MDPDTSPWLWAGRDRNPERVSDDVPTIERVSYELFSEGYSLGEPFHVSSFWGRRIHEDEFKVVLDIIERINLSMRHEPKIVKSLENGKPVMHLTLREKNPKARRLGPNVNHQQLMVIERYFETEFEIQGNAEEFYVNRREFFPWKDFPPEAQACPELWTDYTSPPAFLPPFGEETKTPESDGGDSVVSTDDASGEVHLNLPNTELTIVGPQVVLQNLEDSDVTEETLVTIGGSIPIKDLPPGNVKLRTIAFRKNLSCKFKDLIFEIVEGNKALDDILRSENLKDETIAWAIREASLYEGPPSEDGNDRPPTPDPGGDRDNPGSKEPG